MTLTTRSSPFEPSSPRPWPPWLLADVVAGGAAAVRSTSPVKYPLSHSSGIHEELFGRIKHNLLEQLPKSYKYDKVTQIVRHSLPALPPTP